MSSPSPDQPAIAVIGGSGLYDIEGFQEDKHYEVETPFGDPSDSIIGGTLHGRTVFFLPRHGRGHTIAPHEINHRANIYALRTLGVRWIISAAAVGSLQERFEPRDVVLPSQFFDRSSQRADHTFFGSGIVAHVSLAEPTSPQLRQLVAQSCSSLRKKYHSGGTYIQMDGPAFSTRAESETNRRLGFDIIGMTVLPEAKLAREAEIAFTCMAMVTDYDCWRVTEDAVTVESVVAHLSANADTAREVLAHVIPRIPETPDWPEHSALGDAIVTPREHWSDEAIERLQIIVNRFL